MPCLANRFPMKDIFVFKRLKTAFSAFAAWKGVKIDTTLTFRDIFRNVSQKKLTESWGVVKPLQKPPKDVYMPNIHNPTCTGKDIYFIHKKIEVNMHSTLDKLTVIGWNHKLTTLYSGWGQQNKVKELDLKARYSQKDAALKHAEAESNATAVYRADKGGGVEGGWMCVHCTCVCLRICCVLLVFIVQYIWHNKQTTTKRNQRFWDTHRSNCYTHTSIHCLLSTRSPSHAYTILLSPFSHTRFADKLAH